MEEKNIVVVVGIVLFLLFHLLKALTKPQPVLISKENHKILEKLRYYEHEIWVSSLIGDKAPADMRKELLSQLPEQYHKYIDTQNYINGTKVLHTQFKIY